MKQKVNLKKSGSEDKRMGKITQYKSDGGKIINYYYFLNFYYNYLE